MPAHHNLEEYLDDYIKAAGIGEFGKTPLFRSAAGRTGMLTEKPMNRIDAWRMIQRRSAELARLRGLGEFLIRRPLLINGLFGKVFTTGGDWIGVRLRCAVSAAGAN